MVFKWWFSEIGSMKYVWVALGKLNTALTVIFHDDLYTSQVSVETHL